MLKEYTLPHCFTLVLILAIGLQVPGYAKRDEKALERMFHRSLTEPIDPRIFAATPLENEWHVTRASFLNKMKPHLERMKKEASKNEHVKELLAVYDKLKEVKHPASEKEGQISEVYYLHIFDMMATYEIQIHRIKTEWRNNKLSKEFIKKHNDKIEGLAMARMSFYLENENGKYKRALRILHFYAENEEMKPMHPVVDKLIGALNIPEHFSEEEQDKVQQALMNLRHKTLTAIINKYKKAKEQYFIPLATEK